MNSLYKKLMEAKGAPQAAASPNSTQLRSAPMNLRSAMQKYAMGGNIDGNEGGVSPQQQAAILASLRSPPPGAMNTGVKSTEGLLASLAGMGTAVNAQPDYRGYAEEPVPFPENLPPMNPFASGNIYPSDQTDPYGEPIAPDLKNPLPREVRSQIQQIDEGYGDRPYPIGVSSDTGEVERMPMFSVEPNYPGPVETPEAKFGSNEGMASLLAKLLNDQSGAGVLRNQDQLMKLIQTLRGPRG